MKISAFETIKSYFASVYLGFYSIKKSIQSILPYLFGMGAQRKEVTEQYPDRISSKTQEDLPAKFLGTVLNEIDKCNASRTCIQVCPTQCINIEVSELEEFKKKWINIYSVDLSKCIYCGICVENCPSGSLRHTKEFENASMEKSGLTLHFGKGIVSALDKEKLKAKERL